jgi:protein-tyrosine-phosphatase
MSDRRYRVLFLCTGNSARSILAESMLDRLAGDRFESLSAGSLPKGEVHPGAIGLLMDHDYETSHLRSKSWEEFSDDLTENPIDFVFTVCDNAATEVCPVWPGQPVTAHWGVPDPAAVEGSKAEVRVAFCDAAKQLHARIEAFVNLPVGALDRMALQNRLDEIGKL